MHHEGPQYPRPSCRNDHDRYASIPLSLRPLRGGTWVDTHFLGVVSRGRIGIVFQLWVVVLKGIRAVNWSVGNACKSHNHTIPSTTFIKIRMVGPVL